MDLTDFLSRLLDALEAFDESILPYGLYASDEWAGDGRPARPMHYREWDRAVLPYLASRGYECGGVERDGPHVRTAEARFPLMSVDPATERLRLSVVRFSNVKVRRYGSRHHVDVHERRDERWREIDLAVRIGGLRKQPDPWRTATARAVILVGFDKATRPLHREFSAMHEAVKWDDREGLHLNRSWADKAGRGFGVRLAAWGRDVPIE